MQVVDQTGVAAERLREAGEPDGGVDLGLLGDFIGFHLRLAQDASFRAFARHTRQKGLKPGRFAAMMVIRSNPGVAPAALSRTIARDKSSVTPVVQDLERRGLIERHRSAADRRSVGLTLTPAGEAMLEELLTHAIEHDRKLDEIVGPKKAELISLLRKIADRLS